MLNSDVLVRPALKITEDLIDFVENLATFCNLPYDGMFLMQVGELFICQSYEKGRRIHVRAAIRHPNKTFSVELAFLREFIIEVPLIAFARDNAPYRGPASASISGVSHLYNIIFLDVIAEAIVIVLEFA